MPTEPEPPRKAMPSPRKRKAAGGLFNLSTFLWFVGNLVHYSRLLGLLSGAALICSCAPQRVFVPFGNAGTFHPGPRHTGGQFSSPDGEYDSYELVDHGGVPNQGIPPMYSGQQPGVLQTGPQYYTSSEPYYGQDVRNYTDAPVIMRDARYPNAPNRIIPRSW